MYLDSSVSDNDKELDIVGYNYICAAILAMLKKVVLVFITKNRQPFK